MPSAAHANPAATGTPHDHSIPASLEQVTRWLAAEPGLGAGGNAATVLRLLTALLRLEAADRADQLKRLHDATLAEGGTPDAPSYPAMVAALEELFERANYTEIAGDELAQAFESQALSAVRIEVDMDAFSALRIHWRGKEPRSETVRTLFGLRRRRVDFDSLDRVFVFTCLKPGRAAAKDAKGHGGARLAASPVNLKLFSGIPVPDMEMLMPETKLKMRTIDQATVFVPAGVSVIMAASKVLLSLTAIIGLVKFWMGLEKDHPVSAGGWGLVAAGSFTLLGITMGAWTKYQKRRLEYANAHARTLYFQTLDSGAGAFLRVLDEAFEQEAKEATLAYAFLLAGGPSDEPTLDRRIEDWIRTRTGIACDFEVDDALAKLERLGVAVRAGGTWTALAPESAEPALRVRWADAAR